ncbi:MAG TPA: SET domain-containing protein [Rhizomicrobium sp.]|nr:SET domain-containing protein [Rhizomicrobium sp.]
MKKYLPRTWVSPKLVHGESKIHYDGVFTNKPALRGEKLMEFGGQLVSREDAEDQDRYRVRSVWIVGDDAFLALPIEDVEPSLDENLNHSCDANAWLSDAVTLVARRDIAAGEEITLDQGTWNFDVAEYTVDAEDCTCGSPLCRVRLTENDWRLAVVQKRYRGHFHPLVQDMIDALKGAAKRSKAA